MAPTITVDGDEIIDASIDGDAVEEITIDGDLAWAAAVGLDGLTVTRQDGSYTASSGEHVVSNGGTITLPSPVQDGIVMITKVQTTPQLSGSIDGITDPYISGDDSVVFVSDGSAWYSVDRNQISAIPDSAVRQWPLPNRSDTTVVEQLVGDNGSTVGDPINTADSSFYDGYYEDTDGRGDALDLPISEWLSQLQSKEMGFAFTVRLADGAISNGETLMGNLENADYYIWVDEGDSAGAIRLFIRENNNDASVSMTTAIDDGSKKRVFWIISTDDANNWEGYINNSSESLNVNNNNINDLSNISFSNDIPFGARKGDGSIEREVNADLDNIILYNNPDRSTVQEDYDLQPWT